MKPQTSQFENSCSMNSFIESDVALYTRMLGFTALLLLILAILAIFCWLKTFEGEGQKFQAILEGSSRYSAPVTDSTTKVNHTTSHYLWVVATIKQYLAVSYLKGSVSRHLSVSASVLAGRPLIHNTTNQYCILSMVCRKTKMHCWY